MLKTQNWINYPPKILYLIGHPNDIVIAQSWKEVIEEVNYIEITVLCDNSNQLFRVLVLLNWKWDWELRCEDTERQRVRCQISQRLISPLTTESSHCTMEKLEWHKGTFILKAKICSFVEVSGPLYPGWEESKHLETHISHIYLYLENT